MSSGEACTLKLATSRYHNSNNVFAVPVWLVRSRFYEVGSLSTRKAYCENIESLKEECVEEKKQRLRHTFQHSQVRCSSTNFVTVYVHAEVFSRAKEARLYEERCMNYIVDINGYGTPSLLLIQLSLEKCTKGVYLQLICRKEIDDPFHHSYTLNYYFYLFASTYISPGHVFFLDAKSFSSYLSVKLQRKIN